MLRGEQFLIIALAITKNQIARNGNYEVDPLGQA